MNGKMWALMAVATMAAGVALPPTPAAAQTGSMTRTWVAGNGNDGNSCIRNAPCQTFNRALSQTAPGGEVNCIDAGGFGIATITASVSIICENTEAGVLTTTAGTNGIVINGANAVVTLVGLDLDGFNTGANGILVTNAASVVIDNVKARNFTSAGIRFEPTAAATLTVKKTLLTGNGTAGTVSGGLLVRPAAGANVTIADIQASNNLADGVRIDPTGAGTTNLSIVRSVMSGNAAGLRLRVGSGTVMGTVNGASVVNNSGSGIIGNGTGLMVAVGDTTISGNGTGIAGIAGLTSFTDNRVFANTTNGAFGGTQIKQ